VTEILLIDDSEFDRQFAQKLLNSEANWNVSACQNGEEALERLQHHAYDLVVTDLRMPGMDGLQVIKAVHDRFPGLPVIMITSHGSEDIALQALQQGAASYIPKRSLNARLLESARTVLSASSRERNCAEAAGFIESQTTVFRLPNDRSVVSGVVAWLQQQATERGIVKSTDAVRLGVALEEALMNAIIHGNLEVSSDLRQQGGDSLYNEFIELHAVQEPFCDRHVVVSAEFDSESARFRIQDEGPGFDLSSIPDPTDPENLLRPSGRGLLLMQAFVDAVQFNAEGNCVTLICQKSAQDAVPVLDSRPSVHS
jgi:CheY-like chemotaxis protein